MKVNLIFLKKDGATEFFLLPSTVTTIGRREDCDFCIPLSSVSRRHCQIDLDKGKVTVRDLKSRNGTLINGTAIDEAQVNPGDILKVGPIEFVVQINGLPADVESLVPEQPQKKAAATAAKVSAVSTAQPTKYSPDETQEADFGAGHDMADLDPGRSQTADFDQVFKGFDLEDDLDLDTEVTNF